MIPLFVEGTMNVLKHHGIITGPMGRTGRDTDIFVANSGHIVLATHGGFVELLVNLNDKVQVGQKVAIQRNTFGEVVAESLLLALLYNRTPPESAPYPE
jgi:predicted deacylase